VRVIAGRLGGRHFDSPHGNRTHPMSDKIRGALFNTLGELGGLSVLDAFAGSGALSFEAISRGATKVVAIDSDRAAIRAFTENIKSLGLGHQVKIIGAAAGAWLTTSDEKFDIVLADPPYNNVQLELLVRLAERATNLFVVSLPPQINLDLGAQFEIASNKSYGDAQLVFYSRIG
jgi:16S rRNA (guanine966-N2)-methyltransferase